MDVSSIACWSPQQTHYVQGQAKGDCHTIKLFPKRFSTWFCSLLPVYRHRHEDKTGHEKKDTCLWLTWSLFKTFQYKESLFCPVVIVGPLSFLAFFLSLIWNSTWKQAVCTMSTWPSHLSIPWQNEFEFSILDYPLSSFGPVYVFSRHSPPSVQKCSTFLLYEYYHFKLFNKTWEK